MRRVLLVTFFFPPSNVVGAIRAAKLAKYLPAPGWQPTLLTVDPFSYPLSIALQSSYGLPADRCVKAYGRKRIK